MQLFDDDELILFQRGDAPLIGGDDGKAGGFHDPVEHLLDLPLGLAEVLAQGVGDLFGAAGALFPRGEEEVFEQGGGLCRRAKPCEQSPKLRLDHIAADGFAAVGAALGKTVIIGVLLSGLAFRPACRERPAAFGAYGIAPQREVLADLPAGEQARAAFDALPDFLVSLKVDQALVVALAQGDAPMGHLDIPGIMRAAEKAQHLFVADDPLFRLARVFRPGFEETLDMGLRLEAPGCEPLQGFLNDRSQRLVAHEQHSVPGDPLVDVSRRRMKHPIAVHDAGAHAVLGLLAVLLALMLAGAGQHVLDEDGI